jgi:hypothetical protein
LPNGNQRFFQYDKDDLSEIEGFCSSLPEKQDWSGKRRPALLAGSRTTLQKFYNLSPNRTVFDGIGKPG